MYKAPIIADFNKEQEDFIRTKSDKELPSAPWAGYNNEEELKNKILALSEDKRNVLRAPPSGVNFDFEYSNVTSPALMLLETDPKLKQLRSVNNLISVTFSSHPHITLDNPGMNWYQKLLKKMNSGETTSTVLA